jgi:hypothetical protein
MFGLYIIIILLLIIFGHIYEKPVLYSIGYVVGLVTLFYKSSYMIKGKNESITGGTCSDIENVIGILNSENEEKIDTLNQYCNYEKRESDKTYLKKSAAILIHPDKNKDCNSNARDTFTSINNYCKFEVEQNQKQKSFLTKVSDWWSDQGAEPPKPQTWNTQKSGTTNTDYSKMPQQDLKDRANVGDQAALHEQANRRFKKFPVNVTTEEPDNDFCTIM